MNNLEFLNNDDLNISMEDFINTNNENLDILNFKQFISKEINNIYNEQKSQYQNTEFIRENQPKNNQNPISKYIYTDINKNLHYILDWENFEFLEKVMIDINTIIKYLNTQKTPVDLHIYPSIDYVDNYCYYQYPIYDILKYIIQHIKIDNVIGHFCRLYHSYTDLNLILKYTNKISIDTEYSNLKVQIKKDRLMLKDILWDLYISVINKAAELNIIDKDTIKKGIKDFEIDIVTNIIKK